MVHEVWENHKSLPTVVHLLLSDWSLLLVVNIHDCFYRKQDMTVYDVNKIAYRRNTILQLPVVYEADFTTSSQNKVTENNTHLLPHTHELT